jgi:uncharacterized membrane protein
MLATLATQSLWFIILVLFALPVLLSMIGPILVRRFVALEKLSTNNQVAGFKFNTIGAVYAVLLGFAVIIVWGKFSEADNGVVQEAGAAATLYQLTDGIGGKPGAAIRDALTNYLQSAISDDWPAMERGQASPVATHAIKSVYAALTTYRPTDLGGPELLAESLNQLDRMTQARRSRILLASGIVPEIVWAVLFGGAILTVAFTFFFAAENLFAQTAMTAALCALIFAGLVVIVAIDHPFAGTVKVGPEALSAALADGGGDH